MLHDHDRETCCKRPDEARLAASQAWSRGDFIGQLLATGMLLRFRLQAEIDACPDCQGVGESPLGETCDGCRTLRSDLYEYDDAVWRWRTRDEKSLRERAEKATTAAATPHRAAPRLRVLPRDRLPDRPDRDALPGMLAAALPPGAGRAGMEVEPGRGSGRG